MSTVPYYKDYLVTTQKYIIRLGSPEFQLSTKINIIYSPKLFSNWSKIIIYTLYCLIHKRVIEELKNIEILQNNAVRGGVASACFLSVFVIIWLVDKFR